MSSATANNPTGYRIIDVDAHISEPHDLWTKRGSGKYKSRLPRVETVDGKKVWIVDDSIQLIGATPSSVIHHDGRKSRGLEFIGWQLEDVHRASWGGSSRWR